MAELRRAGGNHGLDSRPERSYSVLMSNGGEWRQYPTSPDGFYLNIGRAFSGDVHKLADGTWQADLNGKCLAGYGSRDAAMERVEYEIMTHLRLAINDLTGFHPKRPAAWDGKVWK